ncbi:hypothetical protein TrRE_jg3796, partial [Triparma retinervis]
TKDGVTLAPGDLITHVNGTPLSPLLTAHPTLDPVYPLFSTTLKLKLTIVRNFRWILPKIRHVNPLFNLEFDDIDSDEECVKEALELVDSPLDDVLEPIGDFQGWLRRKKTKWRERRGTSDEHYAGLYPERRQHKKREAPAAASLEVEKDYYTMKGPDDFWRDLGFDSMEEWYQGRVAGWRKKYRWNRVRLDVIQEKLRSGEGVGLPMEEEEGEGKFREVQEWLAVRKVEWKVKREREKAYTKDLLEDVRRAKMGGEGGGGMKFNQIQDRPPPMARSTVLSHLTLALTQSNAPKKTYSIDWLFNADICGSDDLVFLTLSFLTDFERGRTSGPKSAG